MCNQNLGKKMEKENKKGQRRSMVKIKKEERVILRYLRKEGGRKGERIFKNEIGNIY